MATIHWPTLIRPSSRMPISSNTPFIFLDDGSYAAPVNYCLVERSVQREVSDIKGVRIVDLVSPKTERADGYAVFNFVNFIEAVKDIPEAECEGLWSIKSWHHILWKELMASGYWTRAFFTTGKPEPISLKQTVRPRVRYVVRAWRWMRDEGLIADYIEPIPSLLLSNKIHALKKHFIEKSFEVFGSNKRNHNYKKRRNPRRIRILTRDEIKALLSSTDNVSTKLIILLILSVGFRREEIEQNSLCPGHVFKRLPRHLGLDQPSFPKEVYTLSHSDLDDMIGVMPSIDIAFLTDEEARERCNYRIIGKGLKIRRVYIPVKLMRLIWHYYLKERRAILDMNNKTLSKEPAFFFLDRFGNPITSNAITRRVNRLRLRAQKITGSPIFTDVHTLRHTYACIYLEAVITGSAVRDGLQPDRLTLQQIESYGKGAILVLKENLGHEELATTERYLTQLASGMLGLQFQKLFDDSIDDLLSELEK